MRVLVTQAIMSDALDLLGRHFAVEVWPGPYPMPQEALGTKLQAVDGALLMLNNTVDDSMLADCPRLRVLSNMAVGFDNIDIPAATRHGVLVTNTPDVLTEATAELTWALILMLCRGVVRARESLLAGHWRFWSPDGFLGHELTGKVLAVVGLGRIGQAVAQKAGAFGMHVVGMGGRGGGDWERLDRDAMLAVADVVSLHLPLTDETRGIVDAKWLQAMKSGSYLINTARGALVDEEALLEALTSGALEGAALDVFQHEPIDGRHPLARHPRVIVTPHVGSATVESRQQMALRAAQNLVAALEGVRPSDVVNAPPWP